MDCHSDTLQFSITNYLNNMMIRFFHLLYILCRRQIVREIVDYWIIGFFALFWPTVHKDTPSVYDPSMFY